MLEKNSTPESVTFLSVDEAAELMKTSRKTMYTYLSNTGSNGGRKRKQFPKHIYVKVGRKVLFIKERLMDWLLNGAKME